MVVFIKTCGFKNTAKLVWQYPAMILTPIFTFWTMGPKKSNSTTKSSEISSTTNILKTLPMTMTSLLRYFILVLMITGVSISVLVRQCDVLFFWRKRELSSRVLSSTGITSTSKDET